MRFRMHRGSLDEAMSTMVYLDPTLDALRDHITKAHGHMQEIVPSSLDLTIRPLQLERDERIVWDQTFMVSAPGWGVIGMADEMPTQGE